MVSVDPVEVFDDPDHIELLKDSPSYVKDNVILTGKGRYCYSLEEPKYRRSSPKISGSFFYHPEVRQNKYN